MRYTDAEAILVVIDTHRNDVSADKYSLELAESVLSGELSSIALFGTSPTQSLTVDTSGGFSGYTPFKTIPSRSTHIIQLLVP